MLKFDYLFFYPKIVQTFAKLKSRKNEIKISLKYPEIDLDDVPLSKFSAVVNNDKDLKHLQSEARRVFRTFLHKR